jgi:hypothetical protein
MGVFYALQTALPGNAPQSRSLAGRCRGPRPIAQISWSAIRRGNPSALQRVHDDRHWIERLVVSRIRLQPGEELVQNALGVAGGSGRTAAAGTGIAARVAAGAGG